MRINKKVRGLSDVIEQLESLSTRDKVVFIEYIFSDEDIELNDRIDSFIEAFENEINKLVLQENNSITALTELFICNGCPELLTEILKEYILRYSNHLLEVPHVKSIDINDLQTICLFIMENFILYDNYTRISYSNLKKLLIEANDEEIKNTFEFVISLYNEIGSRKISPEVLKFRLEEFYLFNNKIVEAIMTPIKNSLDELYSAVLHKNIVKLLNND